MERKIMAEKGSRAIALGLFDGVHLGHREVIGFPIRLAGSGFIPSVFTFGSSTVEEKQGRKIEYIYTDKQKEALIMALGISEVFTENFGSVKDMSGEEFVREILVNRLDTRYVACGRDFRFGQRASCGINELCELGRKYGFEVEIADDIKSEGEKVSSKKIRELLKNGEIQSANKLLGSAYRISGEVIHGMELGRTMDFPTINQTFADGQLVPRKGVYYTKTAIGGNIYPSITNVGVKPTVGNNLSPLAETHILDFSGDLYGQAVDVEVCRFIRNEKKFASLEELRSAVQTDIDNCRKYALQ